jgi:multiple sugar transport system substrate-binding protein
MSHSGNRLFQWLAISFILIGGLAGCDQAPPAVTQTEAVATLAMTRTPKPATTKAVATREPKDTPTPFSYLDVDLADLRDLTIEFWHAWDGEAGDQMRVLVEQFNQQNEWGLKVQAQYYDGYDEIFDQVNVALEEDRPPDLVVSYLHQALVWDMNEVVTDLTIFVDDPIWGWKAAGSRDFYPVFYEQELVAGKQMGIPAQRSGQLLFYNATWARELGFEALPDSAEEFAEQACAAAQANLQDSDAENDGTGGWVISTDYPAVLGWLYAFNAQISPMETGRKTNGYRFDTPEVEEALTFLRSLYDDGCAWLSESEVQLDEFANRRALFAVGRVIDIPKQTEVFRNTSGRDRWTVIPFPSSLDTPAFSVYGPSYQVLALTPERQLASWLLIKWLSSPDRQAAMVEATGGFPLRSSASPYLEDYGQQYPQWSQAVEELTISARGEPQLASWRLVRWTLTDAATQLYRSYFTIEQVPELLDFWDSMAQDLHANPEKE